MKIYAKRAEFKRARALKGYKQVKLEKLSSVGAAYISQIENGASCSVETAKKLADALGVEFDDIFLITDSHRSDFAHSSEHSA